MICDALMFFNELDVLEIRLHELAGVVDRFVIVESTRTFTNRPKPCYYLDNKQRFVDFHDRIVHVLVEDFDGVNMGNPWEVEAYHRKCILRGIQDCKPDDIIMVSDADEIPRPEAVRERSKSGILGLQIFDHSWSCYFLNCLDGTKKCTHMFPYRFLQIRPDIENYRQANFVSVRAAGWHFSFMGGVESIKEKVRAYSHTEHDQAKFIDDDHIHTCMNAPRDFIFPSNLKFKFAPLDDTFPKHVLRNQDRYSHMIKKLEVTDSPEAELHETASDMA